ncbi:divergent polysaccharide deacetylase family protein [Aliigemmobacter aestuarii]|uniref:Divergent polysaccharide deacetylase family protein n=1 Tax=Aliigemmobacter aestuarii TaxID=1445661 RepID=A0A4S3MT69_9RHOB|nr:divergent polysaccharide deacetylase family protein [Gemmobacter aestuarii]
MDLAALPPGAVPEAAPEPGAEPAPEPAAEATPETPAVPAPEGEGVPVTDDAAPEAAAPATDDPAQEPPVTDDAAEDAPSARPQPGFSGAVDGVRTGRLPSIGSDTAPDAPAVAEEPAPDAADLPPLSRHAVAFDGAGGKPLFSVVLVDPGGPDVDRQALADLPLAVTIAIDPTAPDAATAAEIYRAAGKEVVMLATGIPAGATAGDLETTFQAHQTALPEAVAVMDLEQGGFQNDRPLAAQVVPVIAGQGRGLLTWDKGLNAGDQEARRADLASARVFRRLDGEGEAAPVIRRYLDRAAFKAAQDGFVVVAGEVRPETLQALAEWAVEGRSATVALAPLSAVLLRGR